MFITTKTLRLLNDIACTRLCSAVFLGSINLCNYVAQCKNIVVPFGCIVAVSIVERNLNPKAACLKRREEEKSDEMPGRSMLVPQHELVQQNVLSSKVTNTATNYLCIFLGGCALNL